MADHIQIGDISPRIQYTADGILTAFTYPFPIFVDADISVYEDTALKTLTTDYTVSGAGNSAGGTVSFGVAPANGAIITLRRNLVIQRATDFQEAGEFRAKVINDELDKIIAMSQQLEDATSRALSLSDTDVSAALALPEKSSRLSKILGFDGNGDLIATDGTPGPTGPAGADGADGVFSGAEATVTPAAADKLALLDNSDADAPKVATVQSILDLAPAPDTTTLETQIALMNLRHVIDLGLPIINAVDSIADEFEDETGIDTAGSSNQKYDAAGDFYNNPNFIDAITGAGQTWTASNTETGYGDFDPSYAGDNDLGTNWTSPNGSSFWIRVDLGAGNEVQPTSLVIRHLAEATVSSIVLAASNNGSSWTTLATLSDTTELNAQRNKDWEIPVTPSQAYRYFRMTSNQASNSRTGLVEMQVLYPDGTLNMTLVSETFTAEAVPTEARVVMLYEPVDAVTLGTDLTIEVSRDGGTTWTVAAINDEGEYSPGINILATDPIDIAGQPSGTSMLYRVKTLNSKNQKVHAAYLQWS